MHPVNFGEWFACLLQLAHNIQALASKGDLTFAAVGRRIVVCKRAHRYCSWMHKVFMPWLLEPEMLTALAGQQASALPLLQYRVQTAAMLILDMHWS